MKFLSDYVHGFENNFNLIRFSAAVMVILAHSYNLQDELDPINRITGMGMGGLAVEIFFVISGFLITKSYLRRSNLLDYIEARSLRIFPGLFIAVLFSALLIGPFFTTIEFKDYFTSSQVYEYIFINSTLILDKIQLRYLLPGVFTDNPQQAVNGSLWTLPYEIWMYIGLLFLGMIGVLKSRQRTNLVMLMLVVGLWMVFQFVEHPFIYAAYAKLSNFIRFGSMFLIGALFYVNKDHVPVHPAIVVGCLIGLALFWRNDSIRPLLFPPSLAYIIFWLSFVPSGAIRRFNQFGDYSYGLYIYAFPVQQGIIARFPQTQPIRIFVFATMVTLVLAFLSWHIIEKPALTAKGRLRRQLSVQPINVDSTSRP